MLSYSCPDQISFQVVYGHHQQLRTSEYADYNVDTFDLVFLKPITLGVREEIERVASVLQQHHYQLNGPIWCEAVESTMKEE